MLAFPSARWKPRDPGKTWTHLGPIGQWLPRFGRTSTNPGLLPGDQRARQGTARGSHGFPRFIGAAVTFRVGGFGQQRKQVVQIEHDADTGSLDKSFLFHCDYFIPDFPSSRSRLSSIDFSRVVARTIVQAVEHTARLACITPHWRGFPQSAPYRQLQSLGHQLHRLP